MRFISLFLVLINASSFILSSETHLATTRQSNSHVKLRHQDVWTETNDSVVLNCSLRVNRDQHVVWHRKYDKMGVHVLTIESETFISDLRIRPIKQLFEPGHLMQSHASTLNTSLINNELHYYDNQNIKLTWNLEIRKLKKEDSAFYYCVLNSENSYGQIYKLNVLSHLTMLNKSEISLDTYLEENNYDKNTNMFLVCQYNSVTKSPSEQIRWYFNKYRIRSSTERRIRISDINTTRLTTSDFEIIETKNNETNITISKLVIKNLSIKSQHLIGKYKCQVKGLSKSSRLYSRSNSRYNESIFLIQQQQQHHEQHLLEDKHYLGEHQPPVFSSASSFKFSKKQALFINSSLPQFFALAFILTINFALVFLLKQIVHMQNSF